MPATVYSLFSGIGRIDLGIQQAGFQIMWANEKVPATCGTYRYNFGPDHLVEGDIYKIDMTQIPRVDVFVTGMQKSFDDTRG